MPHARENRTSATPVQASQPKKAPTKRVFTDGPVQQSGLDPTMQMLHDQARVGRAAQEEWRRKNGK